MRIHYEQLNVVFGDDKIAKMFVYCLSLGPNGVASELSHLQAVL